ncbi:MAG: hypothetical protein KA914_03855 [Ottowia sp.]|nr:hypothetical protein [Ottowia sp.]
MNDSQRRLLWHGMFLFLLGLATGLVEATFSNTRMALAAHLEGVMNGTFLLALGAVWSEIHLSARLKGVTYWAVLYGTYANWGITTLAAAFGTGALSPITAPGLMAAPWKENLVHAGFMSVGVTIIGAAVLILLGLRRGATP